MHILSRTSLFEASRLFLFYASAYALLTALAVSTPLLHKGAPISAVFSFIPFQLLYTSPILIPLALCTAVLALIGRMREDGEILALRASGISAWSVVKGILPLIIVIGLLVSLIQQIILPEIALAIRQGKSDMVKQGITTRINRGEHVWRNSSQGHMLMAQGTDGVNLHHLVGHNKSAHRDLFIYAPLGTWRYDGNLHLEFQDMRLMDIRRKEDGSLSEVITANIPRPSDIIETGGNSQRQQDKPDVKSFSQLQADIQGLRQKLRDIRRPGYDIHNRAHRVTQEALRAHQLEWHMRVSAPYAILAYYLIAAGLALSIPIRNRLLAIFIGISLIMANFLPGMIATNGLGQYLRFNPAVLVWVPNTITAVAGLFLIRRNR